MAIRRENFGGMLKLITDWYGTLKFCGENFRRWLQNCKICECYLPLKFYVIRHLGTWSKTRLVVAKVWFKSFSTTHEHHVVLLAIVSYPSICAEKPCTIILHLYQALTHSRVQVRYAFIQWNINASGVALGGYENVVYVVIWKWNVLWEFTNVS